MRRRAHLSPTSAPSSKESAELTWSGSAARLGPTPYATAPSKVMSAVDRTSHLLRLRAVDPIGALTQKETWSTDPSAGPISIPFPHVERIHRATGTSVPFMGVLDPAGAAARGVPAFTDGGVTHFAQRNPSVHVAAHEATHQIQHAGRTRDAGLGAEGHAHAVADAVAEGRSAAPWIGQRGDPVAVAVRGYFNPKDRTSQARVSDTGESLTFGDQEAYATPQLIGQANKILQEKGSGVEISPGDGSATVMTPDGKTNTLTRLNVTFKADPTGGTAPEDCRRTAHEVMGGWDGTGSPPPISALCNPGGLGPEEVPQPESPADMHALVLYLNKRIAENPAYKDMGDAEKKKFREEVSKDFSSLRTSEKGALNRQKVDEDQARAVGIDRYVQPGVGEAYATYPPLDPGKGFRFHYGAVIMAPGADRVVLQNFIPNVPTGGRNKDWQIQTYGPPNAKGMDQTFHGRHADSNWHTVRVQTSSLYPSYFAELEKKSTGDLIRLHEASSDPWEQHYLKQVISKRSITVQVTVLGASDRGKVDEVYVVITSGHGSHQTDRQDIAEGASGAFSVPIAPLSPLTGPLTISVFDHDWLSFDDLVVTTTWKWPYDPTTASGKADGDTEYAIDLSL